METLALVHLTAAYDDPNPPQLRSLDEIKLKLPSSAWIGLAGIILSLMVFTAAPEQAQAANCGYGNCVKVSTNGSGLRIRSGPGTGYGVIGGLSNGTTVSTTGQVSNGWIQLSNGGWIAGNWVASSGSSAGGGGGGGSRTVKVSTNGSKLLIRSGPGTGYGVIGSLSNGTNVATTGQVSNGWIKLSNGGWIAGNWVASSGSSAGGGGGGANRVATNGSALLMRNGPGGAVIGSLANGSRISLTGRYSGSWAQLTNGAWVSSRWIR